MVICFNFRILLAVGKGWRRIKGEGETEGEREDSELELLLFHGHSK